MASNADNPLLDLPAELRNNIYELVLEDGAPQKFCLCRRRRPWKNGPRHWHGCSARKKYKRPPLLSVCRQIMKEAGSIWYGQIQLRTILIDELKDFLSAIREENAVKLRLVIMEGIPDLPSAIMRAAACEDRWMGDGITLREGVLKVSFRYRGQEVIASNPQEEVERIEGEGEEDED